MVMKGGGVLFVIRGINLSQHSLDGYFERLLEVCKYLGKFDFFNKRMSIPHGVSLNEPRSFPFIAQQLCGA